MTRTPRAVLAATVLSASLLLAACGEARDDVTVQNQGRNLQVVLGSKNFTESIVMGEIYKQALEENGYQVVHRQNLGGTEVIDELLQDGDVDAYPEYVGLAASEVARQDVMGMSEEETTAVAEEFYATRDQVLSEQTPFENTEAVAVMAPFALENRLRTIEDLRKLKSFTFGARPEFEARQQGFAGMQSVYRLTNAQFVPVAVDARFVALFEGDVDAGNVFTTDPQLESGDYRVLEDTQRLFGFQHVALVIGEDKLEDLGGDRFMDVINTVNEQLTQSGVIELNAAVDLDGRTPADVAKEFLAQRDLFTEE